MKEIRLESLADLVALMSGEAFRQRYPYYAGVLSRMLPTADEQVPVMAVSLRSGTLRLHVNLGYFRSNPSFAPGVLLHEVHHVILGHLHHHRFRGAAHPDLMELATEISANEHIHEPLPGKPITWESYVEIGMRPRQSTMERYRLLVAAREKGELEAPGGTFVDHHQVPGGISALVWPDEDGNGAGDEHGSLGLLQSLLADVMREVEVKLDLSGAGETGQPSPAGRLAGMTVGEFLQQLSVVEAPRRSPIDWRSALRLFMSCDRRPEATYARPNRRFPTRVGEIPGTIWRPSDPHLLVAIDTSGSMSTGELEEIGRQLCTLRKLARITIAECDVAITRVYPFRDGLSSVMGRGGTDLRPVFARAFLNRYRPDGIAYFTDGCGPYPETYPGIRTLWVLTKPTFFPCPWGRRVQMHPGIDREKERR
ncbi:MAG: VWA-like domain-containing protein [Planctomycetota bacterium]